MDDKFRIAMVAACPFPYPRGTPIRIFRMAQVLSELGHEVHVITYHLGQRRQPSSFTTHRIPNLKFYKKMSPGPSYIKIVVVDPIMSLKVFSLHRKYKFDIIHAHHVEGLLVSLPVRLLGQTPIIFDMHTLLATELHYYDFSLLHQSWLKQIGTFIDRILPKYADHVISVTDEIKENLIHNFNMPPEKISVIPNGIEFEHFTQVEEKPGFHGNSIILGYAGNLAEYQGIEIMLEALNILRPSYPHIILHLYSNDATEKYNFIIEKLNINSHVKVFPTDFMDLPEKLEQADILLNPRPEGAGHPLKLLNYMAAGKPIVSFAGSGHFLTHGENGWIVNGDKSNTFAGEIQFLIENEKVAKEIGRKAKLFAGQNFSWRSRGKDIFKIYKHLVKAQQQPTC